MNYKKAYKEALERARKLYEQGTITNSLAYIFPELAEDEDERIRKEIIAFIKKRDRSGCDYDYDKWIDWLEKQGQTFTKKDVDDAYIQGIRDATDFKAEDWYVSKVDGKIRNIYCSVDKIESKFKVGDWITCKGLNTALIVNINDDKYEAEFIDGNKGFPHIDYVDRLFHLWSIADAKDGDVLIGKIDGDSYVIIFNKIKDGWIETYGHYYDAVDRFCIPTQLFCRDFEGTLVPATKSWRDTLMKAMADAGYTFDFEKKESKKIVI